MSQWIAEQRSLELLESFEREEELFFFIEEDYAIALKMILAVKYIAKKEPNITIILRPHPNDNAQYWAEIFKNNPNVEIARNTDSITPWISGALAVIQNGCTSAVEAVLQGVPVISYGPDRKRSDLTVPNSLGVRARTVDELEGALQLILKGKYAATAHSTSLSILKPLVNSGTSGAASKMLDVMERCSRFDTAEKFKAANILKCRIVRRTKNAIDQVRRVLSLLPNRANTLHDLDHSSIEAYIRGLSATLDVPAPRLRPITRTGMLIEPAAVSTVGP